MRYIAAGIVDVGLQQNAIARRLVQLDVILIRQQTLELRAVESGSSANQRHPRRIEIELVVLHRLDYGRPG
ncbi:hypothetical protein D9M69_563080 [compost metagenome]